MQHSSSGFMLDVKVVPSQTQMHGLSQDKYKQKKRYSVEVFIAELSRHWLGNRR